MISLMTNVDALTAQQNLTVNSAFQSNTINQLTSGYRINSASDDAAGLSVANGYRNQIAELNQGVLNANQGVSQLQIVDGGLGNISQMLDRLQTLATESASNTFTGNRGTLNTEYQGLLGEIDRQASNVGLSATNTTNNASLSVYIGGGGAQQANSAVSVDLSGAANRVDSAGLGLSGTDVLGGTTGAVLFDTPGATPTNVNGVRLDNPATQFLAAGSQTFTFNYVDSSGSTQARNVVVSGGTSGISGADVITQLNNGLAGTGITASAASATATTGAGSLQFASSGAFTAGVAAQTAGITTVDNTTAGHVSNVVNTSQYNLTTSSAHAFSGAETEAFTVTDAKGTAANISLAQADAGASVATLVSDINTQLNAAGVSDVTAVATTNGQISFQGASNFSVVETTASGTPASGSVFAAAGNQAVTAASATGGTAGTDALSAITAITNAVSQLGLVQGVVGAGENKLNYAISLAQSQITSFSSAQSEIRDANVAQEAANLSQAQVIQQASIAAMAQANQEPQAILKLLQNL